MQCVQYMEGSYCFTLLLLLLHHLVDILITISQFSDHVHQPSDASNSRIFISIFVLIFEEYTIAPFVPVN